MDLNEIDRLEKSVQQLMFRTAFQNLQDTGIHPGQIGILCILLESQELTQSELARILEASNASVGTSIRRLMKAGYVERRCNPSDQRANIVRLSDKGTALAKLMRSRRIELLSIKYGGMSEEDMTGYQTALQVIQNNIMVFLEKKGSQ